MPVVKDTYRHKGMRARLVDKLREKGISNEAILAAIKKIPRHLFIEEGFAEWAYKDKPFSIGYNQTISQPYTVAIQTILLDVKKGDKILEIGTGSGYQACILAELEAEVHTIERMKGLYDKTSKLLPELGYGSINTYYGDGFEGLPDEAPFDKIIVTAGARTVPQNLLGQLKVGGYLVVPLGKQDGQKMIRFYKKAKDHFQKDSFGDFKFVPMLGGTE